MQNFANKNNYGALAKSAIIDLRPKVKFSEQHIKNSCNIESTSLASRLHELPESRQIVSIIGEENDLEMANKFLINKGYKILFGIEATSFFKTFKSFDWFESGKTSNRLWKPSSVVKIFHEEYRHLISSKINWLEKPLKGLDLACGSGRDSVFMAISGWEMTAVDYLSAALSRVNSLANNHHCQVRVIEFDLEKITPGKNESPFPKEWLGYYDLIIISRYLHRPLLKHLDSLLKWGGFLVYQTFLEGCEKYGSPKNPRYLLKQGELADVFSEYKILFNEVEKLADGRPTNAFIARK